MNVTINIDAGGTFTDGFFIYGDIVETAKVPTTEHDLTVCFIDCLERGAEKLDTTTPELLSIADVVRFSTTVGTNTVIEKTGPKLGLLVTEGHEEDCYADSRPAVTDGFVEPGLVESVPETVTADGGVVREPDADAVTEAVKRLQERGARHIVIAFENAAANEANERRAKQLIEDEYPQHYLGALPTTATFEVTARPDEYRRVNTLVINAYTHRPMKSALYKAEDEIRGDGYEHPLFIGHSNGGVARVAKTIAINTHNSGPAAGALGVQSLSRLYNEDMIAADMGGTSIDISTVSDGEYTLQLTPIIDGLETAVPAIETHNVGAGGGSIASVSEGTLSVGPESSGANPGPACFGRGGKDATVTDADLVRGLLNPEYFLGGEFSLSVDRAYEAISTDIAKPLNVEPEDAAQRVTNRVESIIADSIDELAPNIDTIVAFGGAGGVHAAGFAEQLGVKHVLVTPYSSVFSAFGESMMDATHTYSEFFPNVTMEAASARIEELIEEAERDMRAEGFEREDIIMQADILRPSGDNYTVQSLPIDLDDADIDVFEGVDAGCLRLHVIGEVPKTQFECHDLKEADPAHARKGEREVFWSDVFQTTHVYQNEELRPGNEVVGPAVVEAVDTTISVPPGCTYRIDQYGNGVINL